VFLFPLVSLILLDRLDWKKGKAVFICALAVLAPVSFALSFNSIPQSSTYSDVDAGAEWFVSNMVRSNNTNVLSDLSTLGKLMVTGAETNVFFESTDYTLGTYGELIGNREIDYLKHTDCAVVDKNAIDEAFYSGFWGYFEPLSKHIHELHQNENLAKLYDDGKIMIYSIMK